MELRQLRYFVSVARERSFSKASEKLHIAQPALSRQIQLLEDEFGVELLHRTAKGAHTTEAGRRFKEMAEFVLNYVAEMKPSLTQFASEPSANIVVGLPPSLAFMLAPRLVEETQRRFPLVTLRIIEGLSVFLAEWLEEFRLDLAVLTDYGPIAGIERHFIEEDDMVFVGIPAKLKKYDKTIPLKDIEDFPLLITHGFRSIISEHFAAEHIEPNYHMELELDPDRERNGSSGIILLNLVIWSGARGIKTRTTSRAAVRRRTSAAANSHCCRREQAAVTDDYRNRRSYQGNRKGSSFEVAGRLSASPRWPKITM